jgi:hypothetical protein
MNENRHTVLNPLESGKISILFAPLDDTHQGHMHIQTRTHHYPPKYPHPPCTCDNTIHIPFI